MDLVFEALKTSAGILWKAFWALMFGYIISAGIQVLITRSQMARLLGKRGPKRAILASFFGFVSSSCSFAALAASRSVLTKGAHPVNALSFLIASTNLVIELGIVLWVLLSWHFVVGNFLLGILMIVYAYLITKFWFPDQLAQSARDHAEQQQSHEGMDHDMSGEGRRSWWDKITSRSGWQAIADAFFMEWKMAYKEILFGFTVAGFISVFVPQSFWDSLFLHTGNNSPSFLVVLENAAIAPIIAFFTFIGSMGNVPLAAMLWSKNASFGGVMSFLGADLVAATVVYLQAKYYGWKYAAYLSGLLYVCMVAAGITVHGIFAFFGILPSERPNLAEIVRFQIDYTFWLNIVFAIIGAVLLYIHWQNHQNKGSGQHHHEHEQIR
ncbi:permease [Halotia branconii]|uniref:Permease n=1 Tax=Halotia branconii CENA392 TaxID=1539056 RepID=A0AAJ6NV62_9CYAN|nr:permease [Halotia branconii]WGV27325.1 permease [Halotia branconii CENA392]